VSATTKKAVVSEIDNVFFKHIRKKKVNRELLLRY